MAAINKNIKLNYDGKEINVKVNMQMIDAIENELNLMQFLQRLTKNDIRMSHAAKLFAVILRESGENVTNEEVYMAMMSGEQDDVNSIVQACSYVMEAIFVKDEEADDTKKKPVRKK